MKFYHAVIHMLLLFGDENWVLSEPMVQRLEEFNVGFLRLVKNLNAKG